MKKKIVNFNNTIYHLPQDSDQVKWYVMRAFQSEKKAEDELGENALECFIPKRYAIKIYHGVKSKRLIPAIPSLVFVHASFENIFVFKRTHSFLQFVTWEKSSGLEYLVVPDNQMENFIRVASEYNNEDIAFYAPEEIDIEKGTHVRIHGGKFDNVEGVFMQVKGKRNRRLVVMLDGILAASVEVSPDLIEILYTK